jgi:predicted nucleic acid-binding protein
MDVAYFFDTCAMVALIDGSPAYRKFKEVRVATSFVNLIELYYVLLRTTDAAFAKGMYKAFSECLVEIDDNDVFKGMDLKLKQKRRDFSYVDALGYAVARSCNLKFLTSDTQFKDLPNVEFVPLH